MKTPPRMLPLVLALLVVLGAGTGTFSRVDPAAAAGAALAYCPVPVTYDGTSTSLAFAGSDLVYANPDSATLYRFRPWEPCPQPAAGGSLQGQVNTYALAYDGSRQVLWALAVNGGVGSVYTVDLGGGAPTPRFDLGGSVASGIAYDASDDTLWTSAQLGHVISHYSTSGVLLDGCIMPFSPYGLMVAGTQMYVSGNFAVHVVDRANCTAGAIATEIESWSTNGWEGDLECDPVTFAGQEAFWVKERQGNAVSAWSANPGTCPPGSGYVAIPTATPTTVPAATNTPSPVATSTPGVPPTDTPFVGDEEDQAAPPAPQAGAAGPGDQPQAGQIAPAPVRLPNTGQPGPGSSAAAFGLVAAAILAAAAGGSAAWWLKARRR